jgi:8-oxo-dGTP diphosphatase
VPHTYEYPRPSLTVDVVIFTMRAEDLAVLLIKRGSPPFKGHWALPGGFVEENEALDRAALRELREETGIPGVALEQLGAFGDPGRDPRGHTVSVVFFTFVVADAAPIVAGDDASDVAWHSLRDLPIDRPATKKTPRLAFDHALIIDKARRRLQERLVDPTREAAFDLVPSRFTLTELQRVYEAVLGRTIDKRNFRARLLARGLVEPVAKARRTGKHRPAQLYRWKTPSRRN